jgi:drug/metabolite transporter (DMT)-like permease
MPRAGAPVSAELWALFSAVCFAGSHVVSKRGLQDTSVTGASLIVLGVSWAVIAAAVVVATPADLTAEAIAVFGALGLIVPAVSRWAVLKSVDVLGPSTAIPIQQGLRPLLSVTGAVLLLGEDVGTVRALGVILIIAGGWQLSKRPEGIMTAGGKRPTVRRLALRPGIAFPLIAAVAYAASDLLVRATLGDDLAEPASAAMISTGAGFVAWVAVVLAIPRIRRSVRFGRAGWWLVASGGLIGLAILGVFHALSLGEVSLVTPINATQPLIVLLFSALFLRDLERIRPVMVLSATAIVVGAILVSV